MGIKFKVQQIDHVEVFVPDRFAAAKWYEKVLGLSVLEQHLSWADHPRGPLMISSDGGNTMIALFTGKPQGSEPVIGLKRLAFRVSGEGFLRFLTLLSDIELLDHDGKMVTPDRVVDHNKSYSIYFDDPYGNPLEITTYDCAVVKKERH